MERSSASQRGYNSKWSKARKEFLAENPLCVMHRQRGLLEPATVVDHIVPHRGDEALFWDKGNWQALCKHCHDSHKKRLESSGREVGCDVRGLPLSSGHHWKRK